MIRLIATLATAAALTGCTVENNAVRTTAQGTEIALRDGQNCWRSNCFDYDAGRNTVQVQGRTRVSAGQTGDYVSEATFKALYNAALLAPSIGAGRG